jgi:hypothetical protein
MANPDGYWLKKDVPSGRRTKNSLYATVQKAGRGQKIAGPREGAGEIEQK